MAIASVPNTSAPHALHSVQATHPLLHKLQKSPLASIQSSISHIVALVANVGLALPP